MKEKNRSFCPFERDKDCHPDCALYIEYAGCALAVLAVHLSETRDELSSITDCLEEMKGKMSD